MTKMSNELSYSLHGINLNEVETFLDGVEFPATKRELLDTAFDNGAPDHILAFLNTMPDHEYYSLNELVMVLENRQEYK